MDRQRAAVAGRLRERRRRRRPPARGRLVRDGCAGLLLGASLLLAACARGGGAPEGPDAVADDLGRIHSASPPRSRIVSLVPAATETLVALGAGDRLVARTRYDEQAELASLPSVGGGIDPSLEFLAELTPDLVVAWPAAGSGASLGNRLDALGLAWYGARVQTMEDFRRLTRNLGRLTGAPDRADSLVAAVEDDLAAARATWAGRSPVEAAYVVQRDPPMTAGPGTFLDSVLAAGGVSNVFADMNGPWPMVSLEEVVWRDPDYVILPVAGLGRARKGQLPAPSAIAARSAERAAERLAASPGWQAVPAVEAGRIATVDASLFGRPGPRMGEAARLLAELFHGGDRASRP